MEIDNVKTIVDTAQAAADISFHHIETTAAVREKSVPIAAVPVGAGKIELQSVKALLDQWRTAPERRRGVARANTIESLIALTLRHKDDDSVIFADVDAVAPSIVSIFDYHKMDGAPRFGAHRAAYLFPLSVEWKAWKKSDGVSMSQSDWAFFIEEHVAELAAPDSPERVQYEALFGTKIGTPAELIGLSRGLQVTVESKIRDFRTLQSGEVEVSYEEVHKDGRGEKLVVPGLFMLNIPLFVDAGPTRIIARLRYRKVNNSLTWHYQLYRADVAMREAMRASAEGVASDTELPLFEGSPEG